MKQHLRKLAVGIVAAMLACLVLPTQALEKVVSGMPDHQSQKLTRLLALEKGEIGQVPVTKLGGIPWWPQGAARPTCSRKHPMSFVGQVLLSDVPELGPDDKALLSVHYCMECTWEGHMSFGYEDKEQPHGYQVDLFDRFENVQPDGLGEVKLVDPAHTQEGTPYPPRKVRFQDLNEVPSVGEFENDANSHTRQPYEGYFEIDWDTNLATVPANRPVHVNLAKVGGWPSWDQAAGWPVCSEGHRMVFVAQIAADTYPDSSWGGGGHAYLFVCPRTCKKRKGEFYLQTT